MSRGMKNLKQWSHQADHSLNDQPLERARSLVGILVYVTTTLGGGDLEEFRALRGLEGVKVS